MTKITYNDVEYTIYIVTKKNYKKFEPILEHLLICDEAYISNLLETSVYTTIQDGGMTGFFLIDEKQNAVIASMVVDKKCRQHFQTIEENGYSLEESMEMTLLCANPQTRVKGLTLFFTTYLINHFLPLLKKGLRHLFLYVAKGDENQKAYAFYQKVGFQPLNNDNNNNIMYLSVDL